MFARVGMYDVPSENVHDAERAFADAITQIRTLDGLAAAHLLVNTESGRVVTITLWHSRAAMEASRVTASRLRTEAARMLDGSVVSAEEFDVPVSATAILLDEGETAIPVAVPN